ncbi:hypothetical protein V2O64_15980 [Verrucomicrobiaceae bacterium 227]
MIKANHIAPLFLLTSSLLFPAIAPAVEILGTGTGALLGGDLTDPEDDGIDDDGSGSGFNATFFATTGNFSGNGGAFQVFSNTMGGNGMKFCCNPAPFSIGATLSMKYVLTHFTLASTNDSPGRDPDVYRIQGSNDTTDGTDGTWTDIYVYDNDGGTTGQDATQMRLFAGNTQFSARNQVLRFEGGGVDFETPASYRTFRIVMESASGWVGPGDPDDPGDALALAEIEFFGTLDIVDTDEDGMDDNWEQGVIDAVPDDAFETLADIDPDADLDGDTLTNLEEFTFPQTDPLNPDTDNDMLRDDVETGDGTFDDPATDTGTNPNDDDTDNDGLLDGVETNDGTDNGPTDRGSNPLIADTDGDTYNDGDEVAAGTNPNDSASNPAGVNILGIGAGAFLGGDLTDPEDDGTQEGLNFNATFFATDGGDFEGNGDAFDIFTNTSGGNGHKFCCNPAPFFIGATLAEPHVLTHFTLSSSNDSPGRDPDVYRIQGSNDTTDGSDGTWTDIYVYDNDGGLAPTGTATEHRLFPGNTQFLARDMVLRFDGGGVDFATPAAYTSFRINMESAAGWVGTGNPGDPTSALALGELELFGVPGSATSLAITEIDYDQSGDNLRFTWNSSPGRTYSLKWSVDMINWDNDINDSIGSAGESTTFPALGQPGVVNPLPGEKRLFFRVEENPPAGN